MISFVGTSEQALLGCGWSGRRGSCWAMHSRSFPRPRCHRRAKEKRERLRSAHLAPDYIPLGGAAALTSNKGAAARLRDDPAAGSPGVTGRDSDSEGEAEPGDEMRMKFVGGQPERQRDGGGVFTVAAHDVSAVSSAVQLDFASCQLQILVLLSI